MPKGICIDCGNEFAPQHNSRRRCGTCNKLRWPGVNGRAVEVDYWPVTNEFEWSRHWECMNNILCSEKFCEIHGCKNVSTPAPQGRMYELFR